MSTSEEPNTGANPEQAEHKNSPAKSSNTAGPNRHSGGIDTLEVSIYGHHSAQSIENLSKLSFAKQAAISQHPNIKRTIPLKEGRLLVKASGTGTGKAYLDYVGDWNGLRYAISGKLQLDNDQRIAWIRIGSLALIRSGHVATWQEALSTFKELGIEITRTVVSRVDLCVDITDIATAKFSKPFYDKKVVCRARNWALYGSGEHETGFATGKDILLRVYDKLEELRKSQSHAKLEALIENRWGVLPDNVTRVEFQVRRKTLRDLWSINSVEDLFTKIPAMASHLPTEWFRLVNKVDRDNGNQARAKPSKLWQLVIEAFAAWPNGPIEPLSRRKKQRPDIQRLIQQAVGTVTSAAALTEYHIASLDDLLKFIRRAIYEYSPTWQATYADKRLNYDATGEAQYYGVTTSQHPDDCYCLVCRGIHP